MYASYKWLTEFLDLSDISAEELAEKMSRTGIEIEGVDNLSDSLQGPLVVGLVEELEAHPDSDHLQIAQVDVGSYGRKQIVCGAPNVKQGVKVITALEGCVLPNDFKIKESKLRGQISQGMLCSLQEIGFSEKVVPKEFVDGIYLLDDEAPIGQDIVEYMELDDPILELSITPNRADALSMRGVAYEVGAIISQVPLFKELRINDHQLVPIEVLNRLELNIEEYGLSDHYQLRLLKNIKVKPSPVKMQSRLMKANIRPINNLVDVTNYYLMLYGQPMHAFDFDQLPGEEIGVRYAKKNEKLMTLDEVERSLTTEDIVITANDQVIAIAGVMGGLDSHVTDKTQNVLLETAVFNPQAVRSTSRRLGVRSESSARFEKGINLATLSEAGDQATILMAQLADAQIEKGVLEVNTCMVQSEVIKLPIQMIEDKLGIQLNQEQIQSIFDRLGFEIAFIKDQLSVTIPPRRWDIKIPADILEEVARIYGYDKIPVTLPTVPSLPAQLNNRQKLRRATRALAEGLGLNETVSYVLISPEFADLNAISDRYVSLLLPMSEDRSLLRQSMLPSFLEIARYNKARHNKPLAFYEIGKVFLKTEANQQPEEKERLSFFLSGEKSPSDWEKASQNYDFYDLKGIIEQVFDQLRLSDNLTFERLEDLDFMHPGQTANILLEGQIIGFMGKLHPQLAEQFDLAKESLFAEINFDALVAFKRNLLTQSPLAKYPATSRDIALLVDRSMDHQTLVDLIYDHAGHNLINVHLFDRYTGDNIEADKQSLAYHLTFQNPTKTLEDKEIKEAMDQVIKALESIDNVEIR
ncbi:phenylalanine--tRNA ligase subunit beta [Facklamia miroungae]|uniref:Phenylalanine--tRNA ligase beta subunit n=1 Tax=Facklamia miroungae TaxID=120956 RepID=A0A1G7UQD5_9LACT|nr:phenylalanine--tRNA ligase subunit beta [Facklamia miroungae]NKZ30172.1 phenylalanine--tRNA ligase subunit beta [Facklamia miroungae]SDG49451.1 phenylalanyl-tRNA synthetase beta chain [Facklamia miroungae]